MRGNVVLAIAAAAVLGLFLFRSKPAQSEYSITPAALTLSDLKTPLLLTMVLLACMTVLYFGNRPLFDLSLVMVKVDFFAFGGRYGSIPLIFQEVVRVNH